MTLGFCILTLPVCLERVGSLSTVTAVTLLVFSIWANWTRCPKSGELGFFYSLFIQKFNGSSIGSCKPCEGLKCRVHRKTSVCRFLSFGFSVDPVNWFFQSPAFPDILGIWIFWPSVWWSLQNMDGQRHMQVESDDGELVSWDGKRFETFSIRVIFVDPTHLYQKYLF